jgi:RNA recognition motif-containing protein
MRRLETQRRNSCELFVAARIYVGNLSFNSSEDDLRELFESHGKVQSVSVITDRDTGRSRGFGFVEMDSDSSAEAAIRALDGTSLDGRSLRVSKAQERARSDRGPRGGGGGGGYGGGGGGYGGGGGGYGGGGGGYGGGGGGYGGGRGRG